MRRHARRQRELRTRTCRAGQAQRIGPSRPEAQDPHRVRAQCTLSAAGQLVVDSRGNGAALPTAVDRLTAQRISLSIPYRLAGSWLTVQRVNWRAPALTRCAAGAVGCPIRAFRRPTHGIYSSLIFVFVRDPAGARSGP